MHRSPLVTLAAVLSLALLASCGTSGDAGDAGTQTPAGARSTATAQPNQVGGSATQTEQPSVSATASATSVAARPSATVSATGAAAGAPANGSATAVPVRPSATVSPTTAISSPPAGLGLSPFYTKYDDIGGIPLLGSAKVPDAAFRPAAEIVAHMLSKRPDIVAALKAGRQRVVIMARTEVTTDIPEHSDLNTAFPQTDWNTRARGLAGTIPRPATSAAEENILCLTSDAYRGESILIHEFSHTVLNIGIQGSPGGQAFRARVDAAFLAAIAAGKWANTYAETNADEYWAEGVQDWFNANLQSDPPNGIHNSINTRQELQQYDPQLAALIAEVFPADDWRYPCQ